MANREHAPTLRETPTIAGAFLAYGAVFFDRLAPLYLVALIADDLPISREGQGTLALSIGLGWAGSVALARWASGRWAARRDGGACGHRTVVRGSPGAPPGSRPRCGAVLNPAAR